MFSFRYLLAAALFLLSHHHYSLQASSALTNLHTVFVIMMENQNWASIQGNTNECPYINQTLLPQASFSTQYYNPPGLHPSEPNYLWLEAGTNFGILDNDLSHRISSTNHLVSLLKNAGISWKSYHEGIDPLIFPVQDAYPYVTRHNPHLFFDDIVGSTNYCRDHIRPFTDFEADLTNNAVGRYNLIVPSLDHDMHDPSAEFAEPRRAGDSWLASTVPKILGSKAFKQNGALFIVWDEGEALVPGEAPIDGPIGMIVLSPFSRGHGFTNSIHYNHSSTLRTLQEIFSVRPFLGDAAAASNLEGLFSFVHITAKVSAPSQLDLQFYGLSTPSQNLIVEQSANATDWFPFLTQSNAMDGFIRSVPLSGSLRFFRAKLFP